MQRSKKRFGVTLKVALGLALIITVGIACMLIIYRGLGRVGVALERLAAVRAPIMAAAYGMEVNVNGATLYVLNYLADRRPEIRTDAEDDVGDFVRYHTTYVQLVATDRERELAGRIHDRHTEFAQLAGELMNLADRQESLYAAIDELTAEFDYLLDARFQPRLFREASLRLDGIGAAVASADLEAEMSEVAQWVANYHRRPTPAVKRTIMEKLEVTERVLGHLLSFNLSPQERQQEPRLRGFVTQIGAKIRQVVALEDEILEGRNRMIGLRDAMDDLLDEEIQILALSGLDEPRVEAKTAADDVLVAMQLLVPVFLLAAGVIGFLLISVIRAPLDMLNRGTLAVTGGDLTYRIAPGANDEFGDLAVRYNAMVERLQATTVSRDSLEKSERMLRHSVDELHREIAERERAEQERERLQVELRRSETMSAMGSLVAGVAHEVRNPLFGISSTLDAMGARLGEQPAYRRYLDVLQSEVGRLGKLMEDLLSYGRPSTHELVADSLQAAIGPAVESCRDLAGRLGVAVEVRLDADAARVRMDSGRLAQVFRNLVDNALQHSPAGSVVSVKAAIDEDGGRRFVACTVSDAGPGFQSADLPRVFEPFFTRRRGGTGLGLALAQRIVHEHGGEITAQNCPNGGASVTVRLLLADA